MVCDLRKHMGTPPRLPSQLATACGFQAQEKQLHTRTFPGLPRHQNVPCPLKPLPTSAVPHPTLTYRLTARLRSHILLPVTTPGRGDAGGCGTPSWGTDVSARRQVVLPGQLPSRVPEVADKIPAAGRRPGASRPLRRLGMLVRVALGAR